MNFLAKRKVKIVCTLGPSTQSHEKIALLIDAGMDVARLNFSHGSHEFHKDLIQKIREESNKKNCPVAIMQDLQGPKLRVGSLPEQGIVLHPGDKVLLYPEAEKIQSASSEKMLIPISAEIAQAIAGDVKKGAPILFDDGRIATRVTQVEGAEILIEVESGGKLTSHKGMNLPGTPLSLACFTEKDLEDLEFGISQEVDAVALSFVRSAEDILQLKNTIKKFGSHMPLIIPKIERQEAIANHKAIIDVSDALLIARGDMAVEIGAEHVPMVQKKLIHACNHVGLPVITATQMLESMISSPTPTRAEASDVANAVFDGTDAIMLSGETAAGQYPIEATKTMARIATEAEKAKEAFHSPAHSHEIFPVPGLVADAIENSAALIAEQVGAVAIVCITHSGTAARILAKYRPDTPIVAVLESAATLRKLSFIWGVQGMLIPKIGATDDLFQRVENLLKSQGLVKENDLVLVTAGIPSLRRGTTNMVQVHRIS